MGKHNFTNETIDSIPSLDIWTMQIKTTMKKPKHLSQWLQVKTNTTSMLEGMLRMYNGLEILKNFFIYRTKFQIAFNGIMAKQLYKNTMEH